MPTITVSSPPDPVADAAVTAGLHGYLAPLWGDAERCDVSVYARDDAGTVVGGLIGRIAWRWLYVQRLWVDAAHRGAGHGAALLDAAEDFARERGCVAVHLDTFGEEAIPFYTRQGYAVWGTLEGFPPGGRQHYLRKAIAPGEG